MDSLLLTEKNGPLGREIHYVKAPDQQVLVPISSNHKLSDNIKYVFMNIFKDIFLPQGFPASVSDDYVRYQIWDTSQAFCSTITGILATQSVMKGVGVGDSEATPLAATITWVLKDGTGHIGRIGFAWWKGTALDMNSKHWRLVADGLNDLAICLELAIPYFKGYTMYVLCITTAMKAIVGVAGGATRAALTQHQAIRGNLADVAAKDGSQETAVNLIASFVAIFLLTTFTSYIWLLFFIFTIFHLVSNYKAVTSVCLNTFNSSRFLMTLLAYFENRSYTPNSINTKEKVVFIDDKLEYELCGYEIRLGHSIKRIVESKQVSFKDFDYSVKLFKHSTYMLLVNQSSKCVYVLLNSEITSEDILKSYFHAVTLGATLSYIPEKKDSKANLFACKIENNEDYFKILSDVQNQVNQRWKCVKESITSSGWNLNNQLMVSHEWRANWSQ